MQNNKLRLAIRSTAAVALLGVAAQASAVDFQAGGYDMSVYGFARAAFVYDIDEDIASGGQSGNFASISTGSGATSDGHFGADAVTSRLGVKTMTPEGVKIVIEGDFDSGSTLRLRQGYGEYKNMLVGQTWSNFTSFAGNTSVLDFDALPGAAGLQGRTTQVRYTSGPLSFSVEQDPRFTDKVLNAAGEKDSLPVITARFQNSMDGVSFAVAGLVKQVSFESGGNDESSVGYAAFAAGNIAVSDMITVQGAINYSDGANSYIYRSGSNFEGPDAYFANGDLETISGYGATVGVGVSLGEGRSINAGYGLATLDLDDAVNDGVALGNNSETNSAVMINYKWTPVKAVTMGVEYARYSRELQGGADGDANRLMYLAQYNF